MSEQRGKLKVVPLVRPSRQNCNDWPAVHAIREQIIDLVLQDALGIGEKHMVTERELAALLGLSDDMQRSYMRFAYNLLGEYGILEMSPYEGMWVRDPDSRAENLLRMRHRIEMGITEYKSLRPCETPWLERLEAILMVLDNAGSGGNICSFMKEDAKLRCMILHERGFLNGVSLFRGYGDLFQIFWHLHTLGYREMAHIVDAHEERLDALRKGDKDSLAAAIEKDFQSQLRTITGLLSP